VRRALNKNLPLCTVFCMTFSGSQSFVKLQRPFPVIISFRRGLSFRSNTRTFEPHSAAVMAAIIPAAPPPTTQTSIVGFFIDIVFVPNLFQFLKGFGNAGFALAHSNDQGIDQAERRNQRIDE